MPTIKPKKSNEQNNGINIRAILKTIAHNPINMAKTATDTIIVAVNTPDKNPDI
jgi:hypothetical protein